MYEVTGKGVWDALHKLCSQHPDRYMDRDKAVKLCAHYLYNDLRDCSFETCPAVNRVRSEERRDATR